MIYFYLVLHGNLLTLLCNQNINDMENVKIMRTVQSENKPSFNEWCKELKVSSGYVEPNRREPILRQSVKSMYEPTFLEKLFRVFGL